MSQTSGYGFRSDVAQAGQLYDLRPHTIQSFAAEVAVLPGQPLMRGTNPDKEAVISDATAFLGVAVFTHAQEQALAGGSQYDIGEAVSVLTDGAVWVTASVAVVAGQPAYVTAAGAYTNVVGANLLVGQFETSADAAALAVLKIG